MNKIDEAVALLDELRKKLIDISRELSEEDIKATPKSKPLPDNFDEDFYLDENPDVRAAVEDRRHPLKSGFQHYSKHGKNEGRRPCKQTPEEEFLHMKAQVLSKDWPEAVFSELICDTKSERDKSERAEAIIDVMIGHDNIRGKSFLDYGCGEGHLVKEAKKYAKIADGFDVIPHDNEIWKNDITNNLNKDYDIILLYDVLDHVVNESPVSVLKKIRNLAHSKSIVFLRCHPWCSRHGGHLYQEINKAFVHLAFTEDELKRMGHSVGSSQKVTDPKTYEKWFKETGFTIRKKEVERGPELPVKLKVCAPARLRLASHFNNELSENLKIDFIDYELEIV